MNTLEAKTQALKNLKTRAAEVGLDNDVVKSILAQSTEAGFLDDILNVANHSMQNHKLIGFVSEQERTSYFMANQKIIADWIASRYIGSSDTYEKVSKWGYIMDDKTLTAADIEFYLTQPVNKCLERNADQFRAFGSNMACVVAQISSQAFFSINDPNVCQASDEERCFC